MTDSREDHEMDVLEDDGRMNGSAFSNHMDVQDDSGEVDVQDDSSGVDGQRDTGIEARVAVERSSEADRRDKGLRRMTAH
ncbi:unnamed protein product [Phytophthora fragariaefolia]|uniref:Unnamed protein product n=1 Tax=Phytophthora fragariaefolia TaxID=1490495 RepID=A0A9W6XWJ0_9STRA|nr:unnamed protein product [Phytophthora fragariaefolia]